MRDQQWRAFWGCAVTEWGALPAGYAKNITIRQELFAPFEGSALRFYFSNRYGTEPVVLSEVTVGESMNMVLTRQPYAVTFNGKSCVTIGAGEEVVSDPVEILVQRGGRYLVSVYLEETTLLKTCVGCSGPLVHIDTIYGNHTKTLELPKEFVQQTETYYFLNTAEVLTCAKNRSVVAFGDSITAQSWPDWLALRAAEEGTHTAVIRRGISGSRILRQYRQTALLHYGERGIDRFSREINAAGADSVIVLHGVNDLLHPDGTVFRPLSDLPTAEEMIEGLRFYAKTARQQGKKIYLATILPFEGTKACVPGRNDIRLQVNHWIRTTNEIDGVVDFDLALRNQENPNELQAVYDCGDHLHPSLEGGRRMAQAVPKELIW